MGGEVVFSPDIAKDFEGIGDDGEEGEKEDDREIPAMFVCACIYVWMRERASEREKRTAGREWECGYGWVDVEISE